MHPSLPFKWQFNLRGPRAKQNVTNDNENKLVPGPQEKKEKKEEGQKK